PLSLQRSAHLPLPHSLPTRRSSDLLHQIKKLPDARRFDLDHFIRKRVSHNVTFILLLSPFSIRIIPWSLYFFRTKCVAVPDTASDRKSTRLNSSHVSISYAVFCLKK